MRKVVEWVHGAWKQRQENDDVLIVEVRKSHRRVTIKIDAAAVMRSLMGSLDVPLPKMASPGLEPGTLRFSGPQQAADEMRICRDFAILRERRCPWVGVDPCGFGT